MEYILNNEYKSNNEKCFLLFVLGLGISFIVIIMPFIINKKFSIWDACPAIILLSLSLRIFFGKKISPNNIIIEEEQKKDIRDSKKDTK